jgi:hypothetical protein
VGVGVTGAVVAVSEVLDDDDEELAVLESTVGEVIVEPVFDVGAGVIVSPDPVSQTLPLASVAIPSVIVVPLAKRKVPLL